MISSKEVLELSGISRATLNNYIQLGILPKPVFQSPADDLAQGAARLLGFFPDDTLDTIQTVQALKSQGLNMASIAERLAQTNDLLGAVSQTSEPEMADVSLAQAKHNSRRAGVNVEKRGSHSASFQNAKPNSAMALSLEGLTQPAYMLNYNLELTWLNESARKEIFRFSAPPAQSAERNLFDLLSRPEARIGLLDQKALANLHIQLASARVGREALSKLVLAADPDLLGLFENVQFAHSDGEKGQQQSVTEIDLFRTDVNGVPTRYRVYAVYFREGILVIHTLAEDRGDDLLSFLGRRDQVIQNLLSKRLPVMTPLAVLVADLQNSVRICSELPPDEYFELINQIWATMGPILRKYTGTHGKHAGDGVVYYFFPQPESNYLFNAVACADELRAAMRKISADWQYRKNWLTELQLNIGLHEGQEWLGSFQSANHVEFVVLGDTINRASRLSDFARHGTIWATKNLISRLTTDERSRIEFGVMRYSQENGDRFVASSYSQIDSLVPLEQDKFEKLRDIAQLAVTEIRRVSLTRNY
ncbi:adenylate/guanylate cyclase domain-containing protein [Polynucleobacter sp. MWH-UH25E]|uniref:adenylate/guanylate cyclase domain-containing protein n=1 Tax=Polynucleobacter sp. MWH-UH25E TaxID=1855616 RepID=UPI001BFDC14C|nr:adenylate/guanylate cyclase domain-containing protein [Polynucleobacter sp. MWH-UH25E]QWD61827.1 hypothetical protein ICV39_08765 [Polynucleobacter sp. MWH-UH25E]